MGTYYIKYGKEPLVQKALSIENISIELDELQKDWTRSLNALTKDPDNEMNEETNEVFSRGLEASFKAQSTR